MLGELAQAASDPSSTDTIISLLDKGGIVALLVLILVGGIRRWWVFGWQYDAMVRDRDDYREIALHGTRTTEAALDLATQQARTREDRSG